MRRSLVVCSLALVLVVGLACTFSAPRRSIDRDLIEESDPIFDRRFEDVDPADLELSGFWNQLPDAGDELIPIHHLTVADLVERAGPGVVNIYTAVLEEREARFGISPNEILPIRIPIISSVIDVIPWKVPIPFRTSGVSLGSGFLINDQGFVLTNAHVVHNATDIRVVTTHPEREYAARIVGKDALTDIALLRIEPEPGLTALPLGDSDRLAVGELVIAVGNPLGLNHTVTSGLVSAKERMIPTPEARYLDFLQTDSAINPGSSGGPLLNLRGEVVGINTAIASDAQLIGFAIPINTVKEVMPLLVLGRSERGWLGAAVRPLGIGEGSLYGIDGAGGVVVEEVMEGGPADQAGLEPQDVIVAMAGRDLDSFAVFRRIMLGLLPGQQLDLTLRRGGGTLEITPTLARSPDAR